MTAIMPRTAFDAFQVSRDRFNAGRLRLSELLDSRRAAYTHQELKEAQHTNDAKEVSSRRHD
jgi:outer membrane protein TolC